jgi:hypothetical protein
MLPLLKTLLTSYFLSDRLGIQQVVQMRDRKGFESRVKLMSTMVYLTNNLIGDYPVDESE